MMIYRPYQHAGDLQDVLRIYREVGWVSETAHEQAASELLQAGRGRVAEVHGSPESLSMAVTGTLCYLNTDLPLSAVVSVITSRIARKQGLAAHTTAQLLADDASTGHAVAMLGIFEQGYYNQLGFGNGCYEHICTFDPAMLQVPAKHSMPVRLTQDDWQAMYECRIKRYRSHGACSIATPAMTHSDTLWTDHGFGLGYLDDRGELSHHLWCASKGENGPYRVLWMAYRTRGQLLELLALLHSLGDQVHSVRLHEPPSIQLQDFIRQPFRMRQITERSPHENLMRAAAFWQIRILDLAQCLSAVELDCHDVRFNLELTDPMTPWIPNPGPWTGSSGAFVVTLGPESCAQPGREPRLPTLRASVNAFSRLWLGVRSATSLSWTDDLTAPQSLLSTLDKTLRLPVPLPDWDF
jgi:predicted acetyltransferase